MKNVQNPVLRGFNPDPSLVRVEKDYYLATSTFEWFPGISIYHSTDLAHWELVTSALTDEEEVDLTGVDTSCGIWAPNLTYDNGTYYLAYTIVYTDRPRYKDTHNFLITAKDIRGPWSKPIFLNCSGFDPSLFHDEDGRKWVVNMTLDHRMDKERFSGIEVQELDLSTHKLTGPIYKVFKGSPIGKVEGPNITKHNGYYYLVCAEGGTEFGHCTTMARSKVITGPYEIDPQNPILTSRNGKDHPIQRAGHGQLFKGLQDEWYLVHLCSRPLEGYSILGRETAIQNISYTAEGWFKLKGTTGSLPKEHFKVFETVEEAKSPIFYDDFIEEELSPHWLSLRKSAKTNGITTVERPGYLRIYGGNSLSSKFKQGLIARRQQSICYDAMTCLNFKPQSHRHMAGLVCYYNYDNYHYLRVSYDEQLGCSIAVTTCNNGELTESIAIKLMSETCYLKAEVRKKTLKFFYSIDKQIFIQVGDALDMTLLSDEHVLGNGFTGAVVGICCQDLQGDGIYADFDWFKYEESIV